MQNGSTGLHLVGGYLFTYDEFADWAKHRGIEVMPNHLTSSVNLHYFRQGTKARFLGTDWPRYPVREGRIIFVTCERIDPVSTIFRWRHFKETDAAKEHKAAILGSDEEAFPLLKSLPFVTIPDPFDTYSK